MRAIQGALDYLVKVIDFFGDVPKDNSSRILLEDHDGESIDLHSVIVDEQLPLVSSESQHPTRRRRKLFYPPGMPGRDRRAYSFYAIEEDKPYPTLLVTKQLEVFIARVYNDTVFTKNYPEYTKSNKPPIFESDIFTSIRIDEGAYLVDNRICTRVLSLVIEEIGSYEKIRTGKYIIFPFESIREIGAYNRHPIQSYIKKSDVKSIDDVKIDHWDDVVILCSSGSPLFEFVFSLWRSQCSPDELKEREYPGVPFPFSIARYLCGGSDTGLQSDLISIRNRFDKTYGDISNTVEMIHEKGEDTHVIDETRQSVLRNRGEGSQFENYHRGKTLHSKISPELREICIDSNDHPWIFLNYSYYVLWKLHLQGSGMPDDLVFKLLHPYHWGWNDTNLNKKSRNM